MLFKTPLGYFLHENHKMLDFNGHKLEVFVFLLFCPPREHTNPYLVREKVVVQTVGDHI